MFEGVFLMALEMARRVEGDRSGVAPVGVHTDRDLLGHRAGRHEHGRGLAEQPGNPFLDGLHCTAGAVHVSSIAVALQRSTAAYGVRSRGANWERLRAQLARRVSDSSIAIPSGG